MNQIVKSLFQAIERDDPLEIRRIIAANPKLSLDDSIDDESKAPELNDNLLHRACRKGKSKAAEVLLELGADVNRQKANGATGLYFACYLGHENVVDVLLKRKNINVNLALKEQGTAPLMIAVFQFYPNIVSKLVKSGANHFQEDAKKVTPYGHATLKAKGEKKYELLVDIMGIHFIYKTMEEYLKTYNESNVEIPGLLKDLTEIAKIMHIDPSKIKPELLTRGKSILVKHKEITRDVIERYKNIANKLADEYIVDKEQAAKVKAICKSQEAALFPEIEKMDKAIETTDNLMKYQFEQMQRSNRAVLTQILPSNAQQAYTEAQRRQAQAAVKAASSSSQTTMPRTTPVHGVA